MVPPQGYVLLYVDVRQEEYGIAAAKSGDAAMWKAYKSRDFYLVFAIMAGALPEGILQRDEHPHVHEVRDCYKQCCLAIIYGQGAEELPGARRYHP